MLRRLTKRERRALIWQLPLAAAAAGFIHGDQYMLIFGWAASIPAAMLAHWVAASALAAGMVFLAAMPVLFVLFAMATMPSDAEDITAGGIAFIRDGGLTFEGTIALAAQSASYAFMGGLAVIVVKVLAGRFRRPKGESE